MNNQITEIKNQQKNWFSKGIVFLTIILLSLFLALLPLITNVNVEIQIFLHLFGGVLFLTFSTLFAILLYYELYPKTAIKFTNKGFIDINNIGEGIEIEWTNIVAVKVLGKENMKFLGITLENPDIVIAKMKKNKAAEIIENIEQNLPTILIPQNTVRIAIKELKSIIIKFVRDARLLESDAPKKAKNNPFTTEDVLRAFGQLPKEDDITPKNDETTDKITEENNTEAVNDNADEQEQTSIIEETKTTDCSNKTAAFDEYTDRTIDMIPCEDNINDETDISIVNDKISQPFVIPEDISSQDGHSDYISASDTFYEALRAKTIPRKDSIENKTPVEPKNVEAPTNISNEDISEMAPEIEELLNKARSSRITEIEKLLSDEDIPYSVLREKKEENITDIDEVSHDTVSADNLDNLDVTEEVPNDIPEELSDDISEDIREEITNDISDDILDVTPVKNNYDIDVKNNYDINNVKIDDNISTEKIEGAFHAADANAEDDRSIKLDLDSLIESAIQSNDNEMNNIKIDNVFPSTDENAVTKEFTFDLSKAFEED